MTLTTVLCIRLLALLVDFLSFSSTGRALESRSVVLTFQSEFDHGHLISLRLPGEAWIAILRPK